jgi:hypothetical protein
MYATKQLEFKNVKHLIVLIYLHYIRAYSLLCYDDDAIEDFRLVS